MTGFVVTKLVHEHIPVETGLGGVSFGEMLDTILSQAAKVREEISHIEFEISPADWSLFSSGQQPVEEPLEAEDSPSLNSKKRPNFKASGSRY